jgi:superfamily II DNA or RNA helicase
MSRTINLHWGDGYLIIEPIVPDELQKQLRYWHRGVTVDDFGRRVPTGEYRELYEMQEYIDDDQCFVQKMTTMPGFVHLIKTTLKGEGIQANIIDERTPAPTPDIAASLTGLREYQYECAYQTLMSGGGIVACPTGWGKTHIMGALCKAYPHEELLLRNTPTTVICAPDKDIVRKNYEDLCEILPDRDIGIVMSGRKKVFSTDVQLCTLDSLHHIPAEDVGVLIADEVHSAASESRAEALSAMNKAVRFGMSATPTGRFDGRDKVTEGIFGPVVYTRTYKQGVEDGALVPIRVLWLRLPEPAMGIDDYLVYSQRESRYRHGMYRDASVQQTITALIKRVPEEMQTLCIMRHTEQLNFLSPHCPEITYVHGEANAANLQKQRRHNLAPVSRKERESLYNQIRDGEIRKVFSTWVYKQGVNFPELEVIINAGGGGSDIVAKQIPGRESRNIDGKEESWLIDFYHEWDTKKDKRGHTRAGPMLSDDRSREKAYTELGFDQNWITSIDEIPFLKEVGA